MSGFNGRPAPNVSRYIANLNTVPACDEPIESPPNFEADLAIFTNNDFIDWDAGVEGFEQNPSPLDITREQPASATTVGDAKMDYSNFGGKCAPRLRSLYCLFIALHHHLHF